MTAPKKPLIQLIETPFQRGHKDILNQKAATMELTEKMDVAICTKHPPIIFKGTLTVLQEEMVVVEVEVPMALLVVMNTIIIPPLVDEIVITVHIVVVMVVCWMIHLVQVQKDYHPPNQSEGLGKIDKIDTINKISLKRI